MLKKTTIKMEDLKPKKLHQKKGGNLPGLKPANQGHVFVIGSPGCFEPDIDARRQQTNNKPTTWTKQKTRGLSHKSLAGAVILTHFCRLSMELNPDFCLPKVHEN